MQVFSFSIILVGSPSFGGPYLLFVVMSATQASMLGIIGLIGIVLTLASSYVPLKRYTQFVGLAFMLVSLAIDYYKAPPENVHETTGHVLPMITVILFVIVAVVVTLVTFTDTLKDFKSD